MSVSKATHEFRTVLDLPRERLSKNKVSKLLSETKFSYREATVYIENVLKIGSYHIRLILNPTTSDTGPLRNYGGFNIRLYQMKRDGLQEIHPEKDENFKSNDWAKKNYNDKLRSSDLVNVILYCNRLDKIRIFN